MKTSVKRIFSMVMAVFMISSLSCVTTSAQSYGPRSSNFFDSYAAGVTAVSGGKIIVGLHVEGLFWLSHIGAYSITVCESTDQRTYYPVKTFKYTEYPKMMTSGKYYYGDAVTYYGIVGRYYLANVICYAGDANTHETRLYTTSETRAIK